MKKIQSLLRYSAILLFFLCLLQNGMAQTAIKLPPGVQKITSVEGITEYSLPNGLRVLLFPDPSKPIITVNITYKVGSRHENYGETGMAHLLEHLVFKGTPKHPDIPQELTEHGARPNGTTSLDRTNYYETFDATEENLRWALDLESDRMINSYIAKKDLDSEFSVVRNEYERGENNPGSVLNKRMMAAAYQWHNYGHSTIGEKSDIEGAPIERLQAFYKHYYQPDNAVLVVAGKIDEQKTLDMVVEYFSPIPKPTRELITTYTQEPTQDGERQVVLRRTGDVQLFSCMYLTPAGSHPDYAALSVLSNLLTDAPTGRLYKALVDSKLAVSTFGRTSGFAEGGAANYIAEVNQDQDIEAAKKAMLDVLDGLKDNPPTQEEVDKAKVRILKNWELGFKESSRIGLSLSNFIGTGDWRLAYLYRDQVEALTAEDVARVAIRYYKPANRTLGFFIPEKNPDRAEIPAPPNLETLLKDYTGRGNVAQGEDFDPSPENIENRTTRGKLDNGLEYAFLSKETRGDAVNATFTFRFGDMKTLTGNTVIGSFTGSLLDVGTTDKTRAELRDAQDQIKSRIRVFGGASSATVSIETDRENLAAAIRLAGEMLRKPSFPEDEFEKYKQQYLTSIDEQKSDPNALAGNLFSRLSSPEYPVGDPRRTMTFEEEEAAAKSVTLDQVKAYYKNVYGGGNATCAVVGDFDATEIEQVIRETFGDWTSPGKYERIAEDYKPVPARNEQILTPDKSNAVYLAGLGFAMRNDDPDYPALTIGGQILGGGFLNSRLATRIRQQDGLSYSVRGSFGASPLDKNGSFNGFMIYNPENLDKLEVAFREEIERATKDGFTAEELEAAKSGWLKSRKVGRASDSGLARTLSSYLYYDRDLSWDANFEKQVEGLTLDQVNSVLKKYLDYDKMILVKAGDFKKVEKP